MIQLNYKNRFPNSSHQANTCIIPHHWHNGSKPIHLSTPTKTSSSNTSSNYTPLLFQPLTQQHSQHIFSSNPSSSNPTSVHTTGISSSHIPSNPPTETQQTNTNLFRINQNTQWGCIQFLFIISGLPDIVFGQHILEVPKCCSN